MNRDIVRAFGRTFRETEWLSPDGLRRYIGGEVLDVLVGSHIDRQGIDLDEFAGPCGLLSFRQPQVPSSCAWQSPVATKTLPNGNEFSTIAAAQCSRCMSV